MEQAARRTPGWLLVCEIALTCLVVFSLFVDPLVRDHTTYTLINEITSPMICMISAAGLFLAYWYSENRSAVSWLILAISVIAFTTGNVLWTILGVDIDTNPFASAADLFFLLFYGLFFIGIITFPRSKASPKETLKLIIDFCMVILPAGLVYWNFLVSPLFSQNKQIQPLALFLCLAYPILDLLLFWALHMLPLRQGQALITGAKSLLLGGIVLFFVTDTLFSYQFLTGTRTDETALNTSWMLGHAFLGMAGFVQARGITTRSLGKPAKSSRSSISPIGNWSFYLPYLCLIAIYTLFIFDYRPTYMLSREILAAGVGGVILLVIGRQIIVQQENFWLLNQVGEANVHLEERIQQRTRQLEEANSNLQKEALEREKAVQRLRYQSALVENVSDAIISTDLNTRILSWNPAAEAIYGWKAEEALGHSLKELTQPDDTASTASGEQPRLPDSIQISEALHHRRDGTPLDIQTSITPIWNSHGQLLGEVTLNRDISAIKQGERFLERYKLLFDRARDIILFVRMNDGQIVEANQAAELEYGYSREELLALRITDLRNPDTFAQIGQQMQRANTSGILFESLHRRKDGSVFPVEVSSVGTNFDRQRCNLSIIRNISERKNAEQALHDAHHLLESTYSSLEEVVFIQGPDDRKIIQINSACERVLGYSTEEIIGNLPQMFYTSPEYYIHTGEQIQNALDEDGVFHGEQKLLRKDGRMILVEMSITEIIDDKQQRIGRVGSLHDITQRKEAENALRASETRYKALFNSMNEGIALLAYHVEENQLPEIQFLDANPALSDLLGLPKEQIVGCKLLDVFHGSEKTWTTRYRRVALSGESIKFEEYYSPQNKEFDVMAFCPEPGKFAMLLVDTTEQKRAERRLREFASRLQSLSRRLLKVQEEERRHLGRELHDEIGQVLTGLKYTIEANIEKMPENGRKSTQTSLELVNNLIIQVRELSLSLRPAMLDDFGLVPALVWLCDRCHQYSGLEVVLEHSGLENRLPADVETVAYRVTQEALTNIIRHANVKEAKIRIWIENALLNLQIEDRGKGFYVDSTIASAKSAGLSGILERVSLVSGDVLIESKPGLGTWISARLPVEITHPEEEI